NANLSHRLLGSGVVVLDEGEARASGVLGGGKGILYEVGAGFSRPVTVTKPNDSFMQTGEGGETPPLQQ
ncbi:MAG: hypothetical protein AAB386_03895, partial [Patescibacteria group bacterium]